MMPRSSRERLLAFLREAAGLDAPITDEEPLISSGRVNSVALFSLALWIESELGRPLDVTRVRLPDEWDSIAGILAFLDRERAHRRVSVA